MTDIFPSSAAFKAAKGKSGGGKGRKWVYPWLELAVGDSFPISPDKMKFETAQSLAYKTGKRYNRKFAVLNHGDVYEVGRLADPVPVVKEEKVKGWLDKAV